MILIIKFNKEVWSELEFGVSKVEENEYQHYSNSSSYPRHFRHFSHFSHSKLL